MAGPNRGREEEGGGGGGGRGGGGGGGYFAGSILFLVGMTSLVVVTLLRVTPRDETPSSAVVGGRRSRRSLEALHPDDVEVLYLSGIFSSIINVTNMNTNNHALLVLLPALEKFENVMVDESRKLRTALKNHERRIKYLEDFISRQSDNGVQNTQEMNPNDVNTQEIHPSEKRPKKARIKVTASKAKNEVLKEVKKKHFRDKLLKETTKSASVDVDIVKNDTLRVKIAKHDNVLLHKEETQAILTEGPPDVSVNATSNFTSEVSDSTVITNITSEINSTLSLVDARVNEHKFVVKNVTNIDISTTTPVTNVSAEYVNNSTYSMSGVTEYVNNSTDSTSGVTKYVNNSTDSMSVTKYVNNSTDSMNGVTKYVKTTDSVSGVAENVNVSTAYANDTAENVTTAMKYVKTTTEYANSITEPSTVRETTTRKPVTTEPVSIATTSTNPPSPPATPSIDLASLERIVNDLKGKVKVLEKPRSYLRPNSKKRIKGLEKRVSEMRRHYRRVRTRLNAQNTKLSSLGILQGIAYRDQPRDIMEEYEYKKAMLLRFDKLERKLSNYRDMVIRNKHEIRDLKGIATKQDHFITELQSGSDRFEHKTREITLNMHGVEQNMGNLFNSLNGYVSDIRWEIRVMLDRVCGDNHLHC